PTTIAPANQFDLQTPEAARGRDAFLVVWREQQRDPFGQDKSFRIMGRRVSFFGVPLDVPFTIASSTLPVFTSGDPSIAVASDGTNWFVVFPDDQLTVRGVRVSAEGAVLDAKPITLSAGPPHFGIPASPQVVWSGGRYIVVWAEDPHDPIILSPPGPPSSQLYETRVTAAGEVVDTKLIWDGGFVPDIALAAAPDRLLLAWIENQFNLYEMVLGNDGTPLTSPRVIAAPQNKMIADVDAAWDGTSFATAWTVRTYVDATAVYEHVDANGLPIESAPLDFAPELPAKYTPSLARSAGGVTVAFEATGETEVSRAFAATIERIGQPRRRAAR
ncbi:MAG TPA: hypothetical protein VG323_23050, partial [Thermoanaerobaculia bacterium]|nr:hypothetical protein [Thermoanaerobaculia bacterium]